MTDANRNNDLLKSASKPMSTLRTWLTIMLGWLLVIALATMGGVSFLSSN